MTEYEARQSIQLPPSPADYVRDRGNCSLELYEGEKALMLETATIEGDELCRYFFQYDAIVEYLVKLVQNHPEFKPGSVESFGAAYRDSLEELQLEDRRVVTLSESLDTGEFNCFTSFLLAFDVARSIGLKPEIAISPGHVTARIGSVYMETIDGFITTEDLLFERPVRETSDSATIQALALTNLSLQDEKNGDWEAAFRHSNMAIELDPALPQPRLNRARRYLHNRDIDRALEDIEAVMKLLPDDGSPHSVLAVACYLTCDLHGAIEHSSRAVELSPAVPSFHYLRGFFLAQMGDYDAAIREFNTAITLDPSTAGSLLFYNLGVARLFNSFPESAISDFTRALEFNEEDSDALAAGGYAKLLTGDLNGAVNDWTAALALDPGLQATADLLTRIKDRGRKSGEMLCLDNQSIVELEPRKAMHKDVVFALAF